LRRWLAVDVTLKLLLVGALLYAATHTDVERFRDKAMGLRAVIYPVIVLLPPVIWAIFFRRRIPYPYLIDIMVTLPFLFDIYGNVFDLYNGVTWFDDALHLINWVPWVCTFGLILRCRDLGRLNVAALTVGFGAVTHILWEIGEYFAFITGNQAELQGIYRDTIGDLAMSLTGSVIGAVLVATVLWNRIGVEWTSPAGRRRSGQ
jgi:glycopeptide antibiotics resistance protein